MSHLFRSLLFISVVLLTISFSSRDLKTGGTQIRSLSINKGAHIAIIGNTLADRLQEDGWLETYVQERFPDKDLTFRNLGFSADEVKLRQREEAFGTPEEWLSHVEADVVFAFFGFNESFAGEAGLVKFKTDMTEFVRKTKEANFNGKSAPQLVLFSPIANENLKSKFLPDGAENNKRIEMYTKVIADLAAQENVSFVDLYAITKNFYATNSEKEPYTVNGIHLNYKGNKALANAIDNELFGKSADHNKNKMTLLNDAVKDKDWHWFNKYRTTDGYNVYGGRSWLKFGELMNRDVMLREMDMFEVMTKNRDRAIWTVAKMNDTFKEDGADLAARKVKIDDSNLPEPIVPKSYLNDYKTPREEPYTYLGAEEAIKKMTIPVDLKVNLFASEEQFPDLINPMQMTFDMNERLWVVTWPTYPHWNPRGAMNDKILIFPDDDGDGKADREIVWADGLNSITGFCFWNGGVVVASPPELYFMKDTDGDDKADVKIRLLDGLSSADSHHSANSFQLGPDGALYWQRGIFNKKAIETPYGPFRSGIAGIYRFDPLTFQYSFHFPIGPNPHGDTFDQWGNQFATDGTSGTGYYINIGKGQPARQLFEQKVRPIAGINILSSEQFPAKYNGDLMLCNVIGYQGVKDQGFKIEGADIKAYEKGSLIHSSDPNFRPSGVGVGGDGAVYILDWHNALIGHMQHNMRDPARDHSHGRIYRLVGKDRSLLKPVKLKGMPIDEVISHLRSKQNGTRYRVRTELTGRDPQEVLTAIKKFSDPLDPKNPGDEQALLESLWVYQMQRVVNNELLQKVLKVPDARVRAAATKVLGNWGTKVEGGIAMLMNAANDQDPLVRAQAILAANNIEGFDAAEVVMEAASHPLDIQLKEQVAFARQSVDKYWRQALKDGKELSKPAVSFVIKNGTPEEISRLKQTEEVSRKLLAMDDVPVEIGTAALMNLEKLTSKNKVRILLELMSNKEGAGSGIYQLFNSLSKEELLKQQPGIHALLINETAPSPARTAAVAALVKMGETPAAIFSKVAKSAKGISAFIIAVQGIDDARKKDEFYSIVRALLFNKSPYLQANVDIGSVMGRYVQVSIPKDKSALALAEVEVFSGAVNVARNGKAKQSGIAYNGKPELAIDGNTDGVFGNGSTSHTSESGNNPWWEVDLGKAYSINKINVWNRVDCCDDRLANFTLKILDENHEVILINEKNPKPSPMLNMPVSGMSSTGSVAALAMNTLVSMPGHREDALADMSKLLTEGRLQDVVVNTLSSMDMNAVPDNKVSTLSQSVLRQLQKIPALNRDQAAFKNGVKFLTGISGRLLKHEQVKLTDEMRQLQLIEITINSLPEQMKFDLSEFNVVAGQPVKITFRNPDAMPHNLVILYPGKAQEVGMLASAMPDGFKKNYVPASKEIIASSRLIKKGEVAVLKFMAPKKMGDYDFICSFPGHWMMMRGIMKVGDKVKKEADKYKVVYKGDSGPGLGKKIVFISSDHEYRSEESLPALARILAKRYGFTCTVIWALDSNGHIHPGSSDIKGLEALDDADLMVIFTRFANFPGEEMQHIDKYLKRGGPVMGFRTATHAFNIKNNPQWQQYDFEYKGPMTEWKDGFGELILGETWVGHYGTNHQQASKLIVEAAQKDHPIMRGVKDAWAHSGGYKAYPESSGATILARGKILNGMTPDATADTSKEMLPVAWTRNYKLTSGATGRVFTTTHGASEDLLSDGFRRMIINAAFWAIGMENQIKVDNNIDFVGPYKPTTFNFNGYKANVKPSDLAGFESLIMPGEVVKAKKE